MRKSYFLVLLLTFSVGLMAQTPNESQAKKIVGRAVAQLLQSARIYSFTSTYTAGHSGDSHSSRGKCASQGKKSFVDYAGMQTYFDGKTQWVYMAEINEVSISTPSLEEQRESNPLLLIADYDKTHRVGFDQDKSESCHLLCLYPTVAKQVEYFRIKVSIDKQTYEIKRIEFCQRNADRIVFVIDGWKALPKDFSFAFDASKYPGVELNDLR